ncbi:hypothetical protein PJN31_28910, partial [Mycobacterium kansasii]
IYDDVKKEMQDRGVFFIKKSDEKALADTMFKPEGGVKGPIPGMSAQKIADLAGIKVPAGTKVLAAEITGVGPKFPLSQEKLCPMISVYKA